MTKDSMEDTEKTRRKTRWFCGVPAGTNLLVLRDLLLAAAAAWGGTVLSVAVLQLFFGRTLGGSQISAAVFLANRLVLLMVGAFVLVAFLLLRNRYAVLYRLDREKIYCESVRRTSGPVRDSLHFLPFPIGEILDSPRSATKEVRWPEVRSLHPLEGLRVILLKGGRGTLMRIYCPDRNTFEAVLLFCRDRLDGKTEMHPEETDNLPFPGNGETMGGAAEEEIRKEGRG